MGRRRPPVINDADEGSLKENDEITVKSGRINSTPLSLTSYTHCFKCITNLTTALVGLFSPYFQDFSTNTVGDFVYDFEGKLARLLQPSFESSQTASHAKIVDFCRQPHSTTRGQALVEDFNQLVVAGLIVDGLRG